MEGGGREPVLLVSGMGGSVLHARRRSNPKFDLRVWVRILFANLDFKKYLWSLYNADTGGLLGCPLELCHHMGCPFRWRLNRAGDLGSGSLKRASGCLFLRRVRGAVGRRRGDCRAGGRSRAVRHRRSRSFLGELSCAGSMED